MNAAACMNVSELWRVASHTVPSHSQVARAGRFGTKGLAITFVSDETDAKILNDVQDRFEVNVAELPEEIDISTYSESSVLCILSMKEWTLIKICFQI